MSFSALARELAAEGVITSEKKFVFYARYKKMTNIKSGRFRVNTGWSPAKVLDQLVNGLPYLERVTIPEGLAWWETGRRLEQAGLVRFEDFEKVIHDPAFLRHWGIPFPSAEGFLFPDTYLIGRPLELNEASARSVAGRMVDTFWRRTAGLWPEGKPPGPGKAGLVRDRVRLASIVEKETAVPNERARVAGVYANRLQAGMRLQADPTVIYGLGPSFSGPIRRSQLNDAGNPYNTYQKNGLPPGPICLPVWPQPLLRSSISFFTLSPLATEATPSAPICAITTALLICTGRTSGAGKTRRPRPAGRGHERSGGE